MLEFNGKVALITAAAAGIGEATATLFARHGAAVMLADIDEKNGQMVAERLSQQGAKAQFIGCDARKESDLKRLVEHTVDSFGGLHIAANIVGYSHPEAIGKELHLQTELGWDETQIASLRSVFLAMKHQLCHMIDNGGGAICNVTSLAALTHVADSGAAYATAKAGVIRLTKFAAVNYADRGIRVNCIAPGTTPTAAFQKLGPELAQQLIDQLIQQQAIKRAIDPSEQAEAIRWLCSDAAAMVTGHVLPVDGGWSAG